MVKKNLFFKPIFSYNMFKSRKMSFRKSPMIFQQNLKQLKSFKDEWKLNSITSSSFNHTYIKEQCLSVSLSVYPCVCLSVCLSLRVSVCPSVSLLISFFFRNRCVLCKMNQLMLYIYR